MVEAILNVRFRLVWRTAVPKDLGPSEDPAAWYRDELRKHIRKGKLLKITNMSQDKEMSEINIKATRYRTGPIPAAQLVNKTKYN